MQSQKSNQKLSPKETSRFEFQAIGTSWHIHIYDAISKNAEEKLFSEIKNRIDIFDKTYSRFRKDSLVWKISEKIGEYVFPADAEKLFSMYREIYDATNGFVTPLMGRLISDLGYDEKYSLKPKEKIGDVPKWDDVMIYKNLTLTTKEPVLLDFGAAGKGYLIDIVYELIKESGVKTFMVNAGGDIRLQSAGEKVFTIGLENPKNFKEIVGTVKIKTGSIAGSAGSRRHWDKYHHILNPKTKSSPDNIAAIWVLADTTILADALTTVLFFISPEKVLEKFSFECMILYSDFSAYVSKGFPGELFKK